MKRREFKILTKFFDVYIELFRGGNLRHKIEIVTESKIYRIEKFRGKSWKKNF